jgi:hypothetical protein
VEDKARLLELKLKAANYEIEQMTGDYRRMSEQEASLVTENKEKTVVIAELQRELQELREKEQEQQQQMSSLNGRNKELLETLSETNEALEGLQSELFEMKAKLRNNNQREERDEEREREESKGSRGSRLPDISSPHRQSHRTHHTHEDEEEGPDEASQSYSADGYQKHLPRDHQSDSDGGEKPIGVKGLRAKSKKKKEKKKLLAGDLVLPSITQQKRGAAAGGGGGEGSVVSALSFESSDGDEEKKKRKGLRSSRSQSDAISARGSAGVAAGAASVVAYRVSQPLVDERQARQQRLTEQRQKAGGCSQCGKKIKGEVKMLPSSLKNLIVAGQPQGQGQGQGAGQGNQTAARESTSSPSHGHGSVISEAFFAGLFPSFHHLSSSHLSSSVSLLCRVCCCVVSVAVCRAGYPILENHLDHQLATRDKYSHPRGQHCVFCTWDCAKYAPPPLPSPVPSHPSSPVLPSPVLTSPHLSCDCDCQEMELQEHSGQSPIRNS